MALSSPFTRLIVTFLAVVFLSAVVVAETNASRFRRGLGPKEPRGIRGTKTSPAKRRVRRQLGPSCLPFLSNTGVILVSDYTTSAPIGYVQQQTSSSDLYFVPTMDLDTALQVTLPPDQSSQFAITQPTPYSAFASWPYFGAYGDTTQEDNSANYAYLTDVTYSAAYSTTSGGSVTAINNYPAEASIWSINCVTGELTATWTNEDVSVPQTTQDIFYSPYGAVIGLTGNFVLFANGGMDISQVTLTFVPNSS